VITSGITTAPSHSGHERLCGALRSQDRNAEHSVSGHTASIAAKQSAQQLVEKQVV
jgi:hypothetical protein